MRGTTIKDVAAAAGVSIKTVSRVLNKETYVAPQTAARVTAIAAKLKYQPDFAARSLRSSRSHLFGLILPTRVGSAFSAAMQTGASRICRATGHHLVVEWLEDGVTPFHVQLAEMFDRVWLGGALLTPPLSYSEKVLALLEDRKIPYVRIGPDQQFKRSSYVDVNNKKLAFEMTCHLIELGHHRISFLKGPADHPSARARFSGFQEAMRKYQLPLSPAFILAGSFAFESVLLCVEQMLCGKKRPTAIFAANDNMALAALSVAQRLKIEVPKELSIAGCDDIPGATMTWPGLTTIRLPMEDMAARATQLLIDQVHRQSVSGIQMDFHLVVRGSTARASK